MPSIQPSVKDQWSWLVKNAIGNDAAKTPFNHMVHSLASTGVNEVTKYQAFMASGARAFLDRLDGALQVNAGKTLAQLRAGVDAGIDNHAVSIAVNDAIRTLDSDLQAELEAPKKKRAK